jgi:AcrR family transcriptional regulator
VAPGGTGARRLPPGFTPVRARPQPRSPGREQVGHLAGVSHNAPYKHLDSKAALLAAIAARELTRQREAIADLISPETAPEQALRLTLHHYIDWALNYPTRFRAQETAALPVGDPVRLAALLQALAHGAADLASTGHLASDGKGHAEAGDLVDDMLHCLRQAAGAEL